MNSRERYFGDLTEYLVVKRVISSEEVREANEALDACSARLLEEGHPDSLDG